MTTKAKGLLSLAVIVAAMSFGAQAKAGEPFVFGGPSDHILGIRPLCGHVIDQLVHNRMRKLHGDFIDISAIPHSVLGPVPVDIELMEVCMITDASDECGPVYQINFRNNSRVPVCHFAVTAVSVYGQIVETSPSVTIRVPRLEAGEIGSVQVKMPLACMSMGPHGQAAVCFDTLVVAIDSFDMVFECNELNNVAILKKPEIKIVVTETTVETTVEGAAPVQAAPGGQAPPAPQVPAVPGEVPSQKASPSPLDNIDLDELDLGDDDDVQQEDGTQEVAPGDAAQGDAAQ